MESNNFPQKPKNLYAEVGKEEQQEIGESLEQHTPTISQAVYDSLPTLLKQATDVFEQARERDVFLTGALGVLSGCMTNISGSYDGYEVYPNLNSLIIAPPASGKSRMKFAETLVRPLHEELLTQYNKELLKFKASKKSKQPGILNSPIRQTLFVAGNSSSASMIKQLKANDGKGIIFETEADTLGNALKQDWGTFLSELIRCSFQQETIRYERSTDNVYIEISKPKLAIILSGTPNQVQPLISSIQNGLFSRFIYYTFKGNAELKLISKDVNGKNLTSYFELLGKDFSKFLMSRAANVYSFEFTKDHFQKAYDFFQPLFSKAKTFLGEDISSVIFRAGLTLYKLCMVLSVLRQKDNLDDVKGLIICKNEDFNIGLQLMEVYLKHSFEVYKSMQKPSMKQEFTIKEQFLSALPNGQFEWKLVTGLITEIGKKERTLKYWLDEFISNGLVKQISHGIYEKLKAA